MHRMMARAVCGMVLPLLLMASARAEVKKGVTVEGITEYQLPNGLEVLLFPDPSRPKVTVNITVFVGSRHEGYGEAGMAHLLEHMVFKGTPDHPNIPALMKEKGANFNGTTWVDRTNYYETLPASEENLEFAIRLEADRLVNSLIRAEDLATEFSVVRNEFERGENSPESVLSQRMNAVAYEWHNYGKSTIGNRADIERVPVENLRAFYRKYYQPDNAMLIVAGNFEEEKALELIEKYFGALPKPERELPQTYTEEPAQDGERVVTLKRVGDVGLVGLLYHVPAASHPDFPAVQVLSRILTDSPSGRLYKALVQTNKAASVSSYAAPFRDPGVIEMGAEVNTKDREVLETIRDEMLEIVEGIGETGVTEEEVDRSKTKLMNEWIRNAADPNSLAIELSNWASQGDWRLYFLFRDRVEELKPEAVQEVAVKYLRESNRTVGFFIPTTQPERTPIPESPDIAKLVEGYKGRESGATGELLSTDPLAIESRVQRLDPIEGVKVALLPKKTRGELVNLVLTLRYGNEENLKGLVPAAGFLAPMMTRGTKSLTRQELQDALDKNFVRLSGGGRGDAGAVTFSLETRRENIPAALDLLRQVLREPSFPESEFETLKAQQLAAAEQSKSEPMVLAGILLARQTNPYPVEDVRYVPTVEEQIERTREVSLDQVKTLYKDYLGAEHGELAIVGDFEPSEVLSLLEPVFKDWKAKEPYERIEKPYPGELEGGRTTLITPDKANAMYVAGLVLPMNDADPDHAALVVGNNILGGGTLSSRIGDRLRQKDGLSYGAASMFSSSSQDDRSALSIYAIYNPTNVDRVVQGVDEELKRFLAEGVTPDELELAKQGLLKQREVGRSSDGALASALTSQLFNGRTFAFDAEEDAKLRELTAEAVNEVVKKRIDPERLIIVTVGDFSTEGSK